MMIKRITAAVIGLGLMMLPGTASADDLTSARDAAVQATSNGMLTGFFQRADQHQGVRAQTVSPTITGAVHQMLSLNPEFVRGTQPGTPATFSHMAVRADSGTGRQASVWLARSAEGWTVQNMTTNTEELTFAEQGGTVFNEPQINAWYRLSGDRITPLNQSAREAVGKGISVSGYQQRVHAQYGDKLAGSEYQNKGTLGGFGTNGGSGDEERDYGVALVSLGLLGLAGGLTVYGLRRRQA
ncbi:hypothetical protein D5S17_13490 [Pseudonocardiaceae bacterium YIM PH 21723]|nr:hypothetical protein D5S17_13490 [Pseudonocardiaceae bacterium YIM PH 21723]